MDLKTLSQDISRMLQRGCATIKEPPTQFLPPRLTLWHFRPTKRAIAQVIAKQPGDFFIQAYPSNFFILAMGPALANRGIRSGQNIAYMQFIGSPLDKARAIK